MLFHPSYVYRACHVMSSHTVSCAPLSCFEGKTGSITTEIVAASDFETPFYYAEDVNGTFKQQLVRCCLSRVLAKKRRTTISSIWPSLVRGKGHKT